MTAALAICAFLFALLAFIVSVGTLTYVLARRFSTVQHVPVPVGDTMYQYDLPPKVTQAEDGTPVVEQRPPVTMTEQEYERAQRLQRLEEEYEAEAAAIDFD